MASPVLSGVEVVVVSHGFQANYERGFTNGLAANGAGVTLVSSDRSDRRGLHAAVRTVNLRGSQDERRPRSLKLVNMLRYHVSLCAYALWRRPLLHVIGLIDPPLAVGVIEGLWFRLVCRRYVLTVHDLLPHDRHTALNRWLYGLSFRLPSRLVVHTQRMRDQLAARYRLRPEKIVVMEHGIEPLGALPASAEVAEPGAGDSCVELLFFGTVARYKGLDIVLDALERFGRRFRLRIAGVAANPEIERDIGRRIAAHPAAPAISWRNEFVPEAEVAALFTAADALVMPYRNIDQSGVLFQALRFGLPVVATPVGAFAHYISPEVGEISASPSAADFCAALERFAARRQRLSRRKIADIGRGYEWPKTVRSLSAAYGDSGCF